MANLDRAYKVAEKISNPVIMTAMLEWCHKAPG